MRRSSQPGLGSLMHQPQYVHRGSRSGRYAAKFYRPIIFALTSLIVLAAWVRYLNEPPLVRVSLLAGFTAYVAIFILRLRMQPRHERQFYRPSVQFWRGQISIIGITILIAILELHGLTDHGLWILYVLATLIISEHNTTTAVSWTLLEVAALYAAIAYFSYGFHSHVWIDLSALSTFHPRLGSQILSVWLVTFVFHYLVRNIQGRDQAFAQHQQWITLVTEQWVESANPTEQRRALLNCAADITGAAAELWMPSLRHDDHLVSTRRRQPPDPLIQRAADEWQPLLCLDCPPDIFSLPDIILCTQSSLPEGAKARMVIPIHRREGSKELVGILELIYRDEQPDAFKLEQDLGRLLDLTQYMRLFLINTLHHEKLQREKELATYLSHLLDTDRIAQQVVNDVVDELGFGLATISLVDNGEEIVRGYNGKNAPWFANANHPLHGRDVQSRTVREGKIFQNDGTWRPYLDKRRWRKYQQRHYTRVWVPIPHPTEPDEPGLGTIEAGFHRKVRSDIPHTLINMLERYAIHVGGALRNARIHERKRELADALTRLQETSRDMQRSAAFYEPHQMIELIGRSAETLLKADIVMIYTLDEAKDELALPFITENAIHGRGTLTLNLDQGILAKIYRSGKNYFSTNARQDPALVNLKPDGRPDNSRRTFTQRQNIKSFAGLLLTGKGGNVLGFLCVNYRRRHEFYKEECQIIELFAEQAAVALEETYNHRSARSMAVAQERHHLAAELHHTLSQDLHGLKRFAQTALIYLERNEGKKARHNLTRITEVTSNSLDGLQEMLRNLHEELTEEVNFVAELKAHIQKLRQSYAVEIFFDDHVVGDASGQVQFYLLRIAMEAITNALRHARSQHISLVYRVDANGAVSLTIQDDGVGFDVAAARSNGRHGLGTMDYFAHKLNTQVKITSDIGTGTCVRVQFIPPKGGLK